MHLFVKLGRDRYGTQPLEGIDQRMGEALEAVSVLDDAFAFNVVEHFSHLLRGELVMIQE